MPSIILSTGHISMLHFSQQLCEVGTIIIFILPWGNQDKKRLRNFPKVTQLVGGRRGIWARVFWLLNRWAQQLCQVLPSRTTKEGIIDEGFLSSQEPLRRKSNLLGEVKFNSPTNSDSTEVFNKVEEWTSQVLLTHWRNLITSRDTVIVHRLPTEGGFCAA